MPRIAKIILQALRLISAELHPAHLDRTCMGFVDAELTELLQLFTSTSSHIP